MLNAGNVLCDPKTHIAKKMRALFYLRNIQTEEASQALCKAFESPSVLLKHEVAYVLGQMRIESTVPKLIEVLDNVGEDEIVRHEAGEALGNFDPTIEIVEALKRNLESESVPVRETCYIALRKFEEGRPNSDKESDNKSNGLSKAGSSDPAYPLTNTTFEEASRIFLDTNEDLYKRYKAMFYLRDLGSKEAIEALGRGMEDASALFKHEISFICGQMASPQSVDFLLKGMANEEEHGMVRHECAEALGIIGTRECLEGLVKYQFSKCDILRESVEVAIDLHGFINSTEGEYCVVE